MGADEQTFGSLVATWMLAMSAIQSSHPSLTKSYLDVITFNSLVIFARATLTKGSADPKLRPNPESEKGSCGN